MMAHKDRLKKLETRYNHNLTSIARDVGEMKGTINGIHEIVSALPCGEQRKRIDSIELKMAKDSGEKTFWSKIKWFVLTGFVSGAIGIAIALTQFK